VQDGDLDAIGQPIDLLGLNTYFSSYAVAEDGSTTEYQQWYPRTMMDWPITPDVLYWTLRFTAELCQPKRMAITENGCAWPDQVTANAEEEPVVYDFARAQYYKQHLAGVHRAISEGVPVVGYYAWSLLDNFEWTGGYRYQFGIIHVNRETLARTPKLSAHQYRQIIRDNGIN
jgi:beta-glucosidase